MSQEIVDRLRRLQGYATGLHELMAGVREQAPRSASGADPSGTVHATVGPDGLPSELRIEAGWKRGMHPESLAGAVVTAYTAAVAEGMRAWSETLTRTSWSERAEQLADPSAASSTGSFPGPRPASSAPSTEAAAPGAGRHRPADPGEDPAPARDLQTLTEEILAALGAARSRGGTGRATATPSGAISAQPGAVSAPLDAHSVSPGATGTGGEGRIRITLSPAGLTDCAIDPGWASRQDAETLNTALAEALRAARTELTGQRSAASAGADPGRLVDEALAALARLGAVTDKLRGQ